MQNIQLIQRISEETVPGEAPIRAGWPQHPHEVTNSCTSSSACRISISISRNQGTHVFHPKFTSEVLEAFDLNFSSWPRTNVRSGSKWLLSLFIARARLLARPGQKLPHVTSQVSTALCSRCRVSIPQTVWYPLLPQSATTLVALRVLPALPGLRFESYTQDTRMTNRC